MLELSPTARLEGEDRQSLQEIVSQSEYMERLVANLSRLARLDEGRLPMQKEPVEVAPLLDSLARSAQTLAPGKQLNVTVDAARDVVIAADPAHLRELLLALVENAVRHTPSGGTITLHAQDGDAPAISVSDTGPGIEAQHQARIFDRFYRADEARTRDRGGTGLGLSIASAIAKAHGGTLSVESTPGRGATFTLRLPRDGEDGN
jgi:two-component system sensor histidine kinase BaeS